MKVRTNKMGELIGILIVVLLILFLIFFITRWFWCWYFKINARLREQERTNELLQNIFSALVQGNTVNSISAQHLVNMRSGQGSAPMAISDDDIPEI